MQGGDPPPSSTLSRKLWYPKNIWHAIISLSFQWFAFIHDMLANKFFLHLIVRNHVMLRVWPDSCRPPRWHLFNSMERAGFKPDRRPADRPLASFGFSVSPPSTTSLFFIDMGTYINRNRPILKPQKWYVEIDLAYPSLNNPKLIQKKYIEFDVVPSCKYSLSEFWILELWKQFRWTQMKRLWRGSVMHGDPDYT